MNISWGVKIIIVYIVFVAGIISLVVISMNNNTDLVSENYYDQEIRYQEQIDKLKNSALIEKDIKVFQEGEYIVFNTSQLSGQNKFEGEIHFYRSSDAKKDFMIPYLPSENGIQKIESVNLEKGLWKISLKLKNNGKDYFIGKNIFVN